MDERKEPKQLKGFYGKARISVSALNCFIIGGIIALIVVLALGIKNNGFTIKFDSQGGTPVESQRLMYGDHVARPEDPTREGFDFVGWYQDRFGQYEWNLEEDTVTEVMTLYAIWAPISA